MSDLAQLRKALVEHAEYGGSRIGAHETNILADAARVLLTIREAGALIITPDEMLLERIAAPIIEALYLLVDITVEPSTWDTAVDKAAAGVLDVLRDAMPDGDSQ